MADIIQIRRDTLANWMLNDPVLADGEPAFEKDTKKLKLGDGVSNYSQLEYTVNPKIIDRYISVVVAGKDYNLTNTVDYIGAIEIPFDATIIELRAKTYTGTCVVTFNKAGLVVGTVNATSSGVSNTTLQNTSITHWEDMTINVSERSVGAAGLSIHIIVREV